jgi:TRAP-type C4-dicarboxylate transport system permease small subunit
VYKEEFRENLLSKAKYMETIVNKLSDYAHFIAKVICVPTAGFTVLVLLAQVFFRYVLARPMDWYLEAIEIVYIWSLFMAITIAFKDARHIRLIFFFNRFSRRMQRIFSLFSQLISLAFFVFMVIYGLKFFFHAKPYTYPALQISHQWKYIFVPFSGAILFIHTLGLVVGNFVDIISKSSQRRDFFREEE